MASDILHIKDSYYFEVPKMLWRSNKTEASDFEPWFVRLDADYQDWEAEQLHDELAKIVGKPELTDGLIEKWHAWKAEGHSNLAKPFDRYINDSIAKLNARADKWAARKAPEARESLEAYIASNGSEEPFGQLALELSKEKPQSEWNAAVSQMDSKEKLFEYNEQRGADWDAAKLQTYNDSLSGKIFIPQIFGGRLRNAYEAESGFALSKYMVIEIFVAIFIFFAFLWLTKKVGPDGAPPKGRLWNMLEGLLTFVRNQIVVPAMGEHDADRFMPLMWTFFFFILVCNLAGMIPWVGSPTAVLGTTSALAVVVLGAGMYSGMKALGPLGYFKNLVPHMDLPLFLKVIIVPAVWVIEFGSLLIKHAVLGVRLLANMVAGHLVLLAILGIGISFEAAQLSTGAWGTIAGVSVLSATVLSILEVFVAFLQAYIFTFLAALFIGSSIHHH